MLYPVRLQAQKTVELKKRVVRPSESIAEPRPQPQPALLLIYKTRHRGEDHRNQEITVTHNSVLLHIDCILFFSFERFSATECGVA